MNSNIDFVTRAHALWRVRMAHWQQRFGFFSKLILYFGITGAIITPLLALEPEEMTALGHFIGATLLTWLGEFAGKDFDMKVSLDDQSWIIQASVLASEPALSSNFFRAVRLVFGGSLGGIGLGIFGSQLLRWTMFKEGEDTLADRVIGGTRVADEEDVAAQTTLLCGRDALRIGPVPVPRRIETRHFAFLGTTGSGKTTALRQMLDGIERRGEAALVYDTSGEFIAHYYNPARGDIILNPFDARCAFWTPFDEISHPADADRIARQLVSETSSQDDDVWLETSRILVANMIRSLWAEKNCSLEALLEALQVTAVQGYAGTAKTTTVLATYACEAKRHGLAVTALAPTASAATVLGEALGLRGDTVARHLLAPEAKTSGKDAVWIVDEASMLSAHDMANLMTSADKAGARLVLVGDVKQLGSVGAGAAFAQLQQAGMATAKLAEVVRQTNARTREAVMASIEGHAGKALAALERGGGKVIEGATPDERLGAMARHYLALSPAERARTLVIEPSREGRDRLTAMIRAKLTGRDELSAATVRFDALEAKGLTRAEAREAASYAIGDVVRFSRDYAAKGVRRGQSFAIAAVDPERGRIALEGRDGRSLDWHPRQWGAGNAEAFETKPMELRTGDQVQFTRNDRETGRVNGLGGTVTGIDSDRGRATIKLANGREQKLDLSDPRDAHLRHAYVQTAHAAQGQTAERVLIHADSRSTNLVDQKMLYVALSRARAEAVVVTDDKNRLVRAIYERAGEKQTAMNASTPEAGKSKAMGAGMG